MDKITNLEVLKFIPVGFWKYEEGDHYMTNHDHRGSAYETDWDCGNCSGARCDGCKKRKHPDKLSIYACSDEIKGCLVKYLRTFVCKNTDEAKEMMNLLDQVYYDKIMYTEQLINHFDHNDLYNYSPSLYKLVIEILGCPDIIEEQKNAK